MNTESAGQDPELNTAPNSTNKRQSAQDNNDDFVQSNPYLVPKDKLKFIVKNLSSSNTAANVGRNKRKNFSPRYTSNSPMDTINASPNPPTPSDNPESGDDHHHPSQLTASKNKRKSSKTFRGFESSGGSSANAGVHGLANPPWMQMFSQYAPAASLMAQNPVPSGRGGNRQMAPPEYAMPAAVSDTSEWVRKFGWSESAVTAIRDVFKAYQVREDTEQQADENNSVNLSNETESEAPPDTLQIYNNSHLNVPNGSGHHEPSSSTNPSPLHNSPTKEEIIHDSPRPQASSEMSSSVQGEFATNPSVKAQQSLMTPNNMPQPVDFQWDGHERQSVSRDDSSHETWIKKKPSSGDGEEDSFNNNQAKKIKQDTEQYSGYHDDSSDFCDRQQQAGGSASRHLSEWCKDFQKNPPESYGKRIRSECDDTDTTAGDADNNPYDEDGYPVSLNDFTDSLNEDEDNEDAHSVNLFSEDQRSPVDGQLRAQLNSKRDDAEAADFDQENRSLVAEKEESCSTSSSKMSTQDFAGFPDENQLTRVLSKSGGGTDDKNDQSDSAQNMSKVASYLECQNERCRSENIREHYHCNDLPCYGKIIFKKDEVIRHIKWHRKRIESLNHGFMRFSSSDECSTTFGICPHNRKQTHYHCIQPNCERVYISTSDVQMHSNYHRKDSAIHKEGFQRFRGNEKCSADYCLFAGLWTTHYHCRRDNCRYTFKNKSDMEKHKSYHIKDMQLIREGFKKFLKNEPCPFELCRFSMLCNHIHCSRENCFYVLQSSGQLLSHKRKHERMDNEQTYCRYKMLAVKASLLGNPSDVAASSPDVASPYNFTNSLLQLKDFDTNSQSIPRTTSEPLLSSNNDSTVKPSTFSMEFLHQMKQRHEELLKRDDGDQHPPQPTTSGSAFSRSIPSSSSPQHQYNMGLESNRLTPSIIKQFLTNECPYRLRDIDEPINVKGVAADDGNPHKVQECLWEAGLEPHLHCIVSDCQAVIPNNVLAITAHIKMHGYNRDVYATTAAATNTEPSAGAATAISNNPMQITTIDGFFNRKRGRPPKNRFVEVYKNAQQSPQAIFTSFKLEKQTLNKDRSPVNDTSPSPSHSQPMTGSFSANASGDPQHNRLQQFAEENRQMNLSSTQPLRQATVQNPTSPQFTTYNANEHCGNLCSLNMQHHYHCACSADCEFKTVERDLLSVHLERQHTAPTFADRISEKFKRFDRKIGLDCGIVECRLRKTRPHLHCRYCSHQISPFDFETHICVKSEQSSMPSHPLMKLSTMCGPEQRQQTELSGEHFTIHSTKNIIGDYSSRIPAVTFSTLSELRNKVSEIEPETSFFPKRPQEDEKVFVVRAAGTYFPENTTELTGIPSQSQQKQTPSSTAAECMQFQIGTLTTSFCSRPYCKMKRKLHEHCEFCDQSFMDPAKLRVHRLKHLGIRDLTKTLPSHYPLLQSADAGVEKNRKSVYTEAPLSLETRSAQLPNAYDEQPQDLTLSPNTAAAANLPIRETLPAPSPVLPSGPISNIFAPNVISGLSMQNFHFAQLATLYQQNPYYYQHLYPLLSNAAALTRHHQQQQSQTFLAPSNDDKQYPGTDCSQSPAPVGIPPSGQFPFFNPFLLARTTETAITQPPAAVPIIPPSVAVPLRTATPPTMVTPKSIKRKPSNAGEDFNSFIERMSPSSKKQMQFAAGLAAAAAAAAASTTGTNASGNIQSGSTNSGNVEQHGQHFKIKDEQIPTGYLKFRFNEDCYFAKCGYRNHQSHFHCDRIDCHYSFCDKTRFVQHTARHERLDKLMGSDFRQYRANMNCGYENCPYFKNLGSANKSSHFHCLKCDFICSDTNKVVAHRRQHSKMEYIRMAGFRKVTNSEKCNSTFEATVSTKKTEGGPGTIECSYSQKQTHYHCLVCDVSVLSRAQLASHKHKT